MHKPKYVLENKTHEILSDFEMQTDHLIPARKPDLALINKRKKKNLSFDRVCHSRWP